MQIVIPKGFAPVILQTGRTDSLPGENGAVKEIMPKEDWNSITKEQINKGIVVVDNKIDLQEKLILAFGSEHMSVEMTPSDLKQILDYEYSDSVIYVDVVENG